VRSPLVRYGDDYYLPLARADGYGSIPKRGHTIFNVYAEMLMQISRDYNCLPPVDTLTMSDIRWWYNGLRAELQERTKPREK
jgi:hypothetical protein